MSMYTSQGALQKTKRSFCVMLDILGYSASISVCSSQADVDKFLQRVYKIISDAYASFLSSSSWELKVFSDNILLGTPISDPELAPGEELFAEYLFSIQDYQCKMVFGDLFVRGAWTLGDLFIDKTLILGRSLIEAYRLETQVAKYPRIILSEEMVSILLKHLKWYSSISVSPQNEDLIVDEDGSVFINYLVATEQDGIIDTTLIGKHKDIVESKLLKFRHNRKVYEKYLWCADYHNYYCKLNSAPSALSIKYETTRSFCVIKRKPRLFKQLSEVY